MSKILVENSSQNIVTKILIEQISRKHQSKYCSKLSIEKWPENSNQDRKMGRKNARK